MDKLIKLLDIPSLLSSNDVEGKLKKLAEMLMNEYCIFNGRYWYRLVEIEFYIYDKINHPDTHVYKRDEKNAGDIFYHYSGMDICFDSKMEDGRFGGILIRSLERISEDDKKIMFGGPLVCKNEVLNSANIICTVVPLEQACDFSSRTGLPRVGIKQSNAQDTYWDKKYRFIRKDVIDFIENSIDDYNFISNKKKTIKRKYKL